MSQVTMDRNITPPLPGDDILDREAMLTTIDNPYSPFSHWEEWYEFDTSHGYNSCGYLGRIAHPSNDLSDSDNRVEINNAIDWIVNNDPLGVYKKVFN